MASAERDAIIAALEACSYHFGDATVRLQIGRSTLYRLMKRYEVPMVKRPKRNGSQTPSISIQRSSGSRIEVQDGAYVLIHD